MNLPGDAQQVGSSLELLEEFGAGAVQKMEDELELGSPPNLLEVYSLLPWFCFVSKYFLCLVSVELLSSIQISCCLFSANSAMLKL